MAILDKKMDTACKGLYCGVKFSHHYSPSSNSPFKFRCFRKLLVKKATAEQNSLQSVLLILNYLQTTDNAAYPHIKPLTTLRSNRLVLASMSVHPQMCSLVISNSVFICFFHGKKSENISLMESLHFLPNDISNIGPTTQPSLFLCVLSGFLISAEGNLIYSARHLNSDIWVHQVCLIRLVRQMSLQLQTNRLKKGKRHEVEYINANMLLYCKQTMSLLIGHIIWVTFQIIYSIVDYNHLEASHSLITDFTERLIGMWKVKLVSFVFHWINE